MNYTTQQLQAMSDDDLGIAFYDKFCLNFDCYNDIMPLAFERGISVNSSVNFDFADNDDEWVASEYIQAIFTNEGAGKTIKCSEKWFSDTNPLRAIACLLLLMDEQ